MADYINNLIIAFSTLGAVFLTWLLYSFPERRRRKKEKKASLLLLIREYMENIITISSTPNKHERNRRFNKSRLDAEYLDEVIRLQVKIPDPEKPEDKDKLANFLESSLEAANDYMKQQITSNATFRVWINDYRLLCNVITGDMNLPVTFEL